MSITGKKLLYISEVPVELSYAGATLMYRLLEEYPKHDLLIVQTGMPTTGRKLEGVRYVQFGEKRIRFMNRIANYKAGVRLKIIAKQQIGPSLAKEIRLFRPDAVISVTFNLSWLTALVISKKYSIPLHLVLHDDFLSTEDYGRAQPYLERKFKEAYLHASGRYCISPQMEAYYNEAYGMKGSVIYPARGKNDIAYAVDWATRRDKTSLNYCYAGSMGTSDFLPMTDMIADMLGKAGHRLIIFSKIPDQLLARYKHLTLPHVSVRPMVHPDELKKYLSEEADVNILLNSFEQEKLFRLNFSSKIVDYTAVDLPVLFWGAQTSGIGAWLASGKYPAMIDRPGHHPVEEEIRRMDSAAYRKDLADHLQRMARDTFSHERNYGIFTDQLKMH